MRKLLYTVIILSLVFLVAQRGNKYLPDVIVTDPHGIWLDTRAYTSLSGAVAAIVALGGDDRDLWICRQETQAGNLTIPGYISLKFLREGEIYMSSGTLTVQTRSIEAQNKQIFDGGGGYDFADGTVLKNAWFPSIDYVLDRTVSDNVTIEVVTPQTMTGDRTLSADIVLKWSGPDSVITITPGKTLTLNGKIDAGPYKIFDVTAGVGGIGLQSRSTDVGYAEWFGADSGDSTADTDDMNMAISVLAGRTMQLLPGTYLIEEGGLNIVYGLEIVGTKDSVIKLKDGENPAATDVMIEVGALAHQTVLRGFSVDGNRDNNTTGAYHAISVAADYCMLDDLTIWDINANAGGGDGIYIDSTADELRVRDLNITEVERREITIVSGGVLLGDVVNTKIGTIAAATDDERPVFVCHAPNGCIIIDCLITNAADIAVDAANIETFTLYEKGTAGSDVDVITDIDTDSGGDNVGFDDFVAESMGAVDALDDTHRLLSNEVVASFDKTHGGTGKGTDEMIVTIVYATY